MHLEWFLSFLGEVSPYSPYNVLKKFQKGRGEAVVTGRGPRAEEAPLALRIAKIMRKEEAEHILEHLLQSAGPKEASYGISIMATKRQGRCCDHYIDEEIKSTEAQSLVPVNSALSESRCASSLPLPELLACLPVSGVQLGVYLSLVLQVPGSSVNV